MSVTFTLNFKATSLADFYDELGILTDVNIFKVIIKAEKEGPRINLPYRIEAQSCWVGDSTDVGYKVTNKGGPAGFKFFSPLEEEERKSNSEMLSTKNFSI